MSTTTMNTKRSVKVPKSLLSKYRLKAGDTFTIAEIHDCFILHRVRLDTLRKAKTAPTDDNKEQFEAERADWLRLSLLGGSRAYGDDEPEYTSDMIKKPNPAYERR